MLSEEVKHPDLFVVYRAQDPVVTILFDLYSELVSLAHIQEHTSHRLVLEDLDQTIKTFYNTVMDYTNNPWRDHSKSFGKYGITGSFSLLDNKPAESALYFWLGGDMVYPSIPVEVVNSLISFIWGENPIVSKPQEEIQAETEALTQSLRNLETQSKGLGPVMMQMFISPEIINEIAWIAKPYGAQVERNMFAESGDDEEKRQETTNKKSTRKILEDFLRNPFGSYPVEENDRKDFQARLYAGHKDFYNPQYVHTKLYYRNEPTPEQKENYEKFQEKLKKYKQGIHQLAKQLVTYYLERQEQSQEKHYLLEKQGEHGEQGTEQSSRLRRLKNYVQDDKN